MARCPKCKTHVEMKPDEDEVTCPECGAVLKRPPAKEERLPTPAPDSQEPPDGGQVSGAAEGKSVSQAERTFRKAAWRGLQLVWAYGRTGVVAAWMLIVLWQVMATRNKMERIARNVSEVESLASSTELDVAVVKTEVSLIRSDVSNIENEPTGMSSVESRLSEIEDVLSGIEGDLSTHAGDTSTSSMEKSLSGVEMDLSSMKRDVSSMKKDVSSIESDVSAIKFLVPYIQSDVTMIKTWVLIHQ